MNFGARETIIIACLVLFVGKSLNARIRFFRDYNIPEPVTGGVLASIIFGIVYFVTGKETSFALELRNALLVIFFITIGLSSKLDILIKGGKPLLILLVLATMYLFIQNFVGIGVATLVGFDQLVGILGGSVSLSGGHGTTIAWAPIFAKEFGITNAAEIGIANATFGLVVGGVIGGPIAKFLINKYALKPSEDEKLTVGIKHEKSKVSIDYNNTLGYVFLIFMTAGLGIWLNQFLSWIGLELPDFVTALFAGILVANIGPVVFKKIEWDTEDSPTLALISDLSLGLFLAMSLMSLQLWGISQSAGLLLTLIIAQVLVLILFSVFVVFRAMGKDYDAAVMSAGYAGLALGATPTAIANMTAVTKKLGGSAKAFIVVPLVGAFFIDLANALIIKVMLALFQ